MNRSGFGLVGLVILIILGIISFNSVIGFNPNGYVAVQQSSITGSQSVVLEQGPFCKCFGSAEYYKIAGTYRFYDPERSTDVETDQSSVTSGPVDVRFNGGGNAGVVGQVRFKIPLVGEQVLKIHRDFRSYENMVATLVKPTVQESVVLTGSLMTAEESYSGRKAEFGQLAKDQTERGVYLTSFRTQQTTDPLTGKVSERRVVEIKIDTTGQPLRKDSPFADYGIDVTGFTLDADLLYEKAVLEQIGAQREANMAIVTAQAEAERARQDRVTTEEKGRAAVMTAKYKAEVEKETAVVEAEREKAVAITAADGRRQVAELDKQSAEQEKQKQILLGQGESERKKLVMSADGALAQKLTTLENINERWASAFEKRSVPQIVFGAETASGVSNDAQTFMQIQTMKAIKELGLDMSVQARD